MINRCLVTALLFVVACACHSNPSQAQVDFLRADSNGDQQLDISDSKYTNNFLFLGGPPPGSEKSADSNDDGSVDLSDSIFSLNYLFLGGPAPPAPFPVVGADPTADGLSSTTYPSNLVGDGSSLAFNGPSQIMATAGSAVQVPVSVVLTAQGDVQAWSLGVQASGNGSLTDATTQGTVAADVNDAPPGLRSAGFDVTELAAAGAVSAVDLSFVMPIALTDGSSNTVLNLLLEGTAPTAGSSEIWELQFLNGIQGSGQPVQNIVSVDGLSFIPTLENYQVEVIGQASAVIPEPSTFILSLIGLISLTMRRSRRRR